MDRDGIIYKLRRKAQMIAYHILPKRTLSGIYFRILVHQKLNLDNPQTLNEKLQWLKLYYFPNNPLAIKCTDKYQVREYVESKGCGDYLTVNLGTWESVEDVEWDKLPNKFVLKCTHGCAYNILCKDKNIFNFDDAQKKLKRWLKEDFSVFNVEPHYGKIRPRRIIAEEYLGDAIIDYKFFCFSGKPKFFYVSSDLIHDRDAEMGFFEMDGTKIPLIRDDYKDIGNIEMPKCLPQMIDVAKILSEDFSFVRVDFFLVGDTFKFAELTFSPASGYMPINPKEYDYKWGLLLDLPRMNRSSL